MHRTLAPAALVAVLLTAAACGSSGDRDVIGGHGTSPTSTPSVSARTGYTFAEAPSVRLYLDSGDLDLAAWTSCYGNMCADGVPPKDPPDVGSPAFVDFGFADPGWNFIASFSQTGADCPRRAEVAVDRVAPRRFRILPPVGPGTWDVILGGDGRGGDAITSFRWTTKSKPVVRDASATLVVRPDTHSRDYYPDMVTPVVLSVVDLASTPRSASARITVTATNGTSATIDIPRAEIDEKGDFCTAGAVTLSEGDEAGAAARALAGSSFTYDVDLVLDATHYRGTGRFPADLTEKDHDGDAVELTWEPALPAYRG